MKSSFIVIPLFFIVAVAACSKKDATVDVKKEKESVDYTVLGEEALLTVKGYEVDSASRIYTLNECSKLVKQGEQTPLNCENASLAEYNKTIRDIIDSESSSSNLADSEKDAIKDQYLSNYTFQNFSHKTS